MLVLSRKVGEKIVVGDNITIVVNRVSGNRISLGIEAPADVRIVRGELPPERAATAQAAPQKAAPEKAAKNTSALQQELKSSLVTPVVSLPAFEFSTGEAVHRAR